MVIYGDTERYALTQFWKKLHKSVNNLPIDLKGNIIIKKNNFQLP